jgi:hypothetical protein
MLHIDRKRTAVRESSDGNLRVLKTEECASNRFRPKNVACYILYRIISPSFGCIFSEIDAK